MPPAKAWPAVLRWTAGFGYLLLFLQLLALGWWSQVQISHFAATMDFANVEQAVSQIAHGVLDPHSTIQGWVNGVEVGGAASFSHQLYFWQDHSEFIFWPLSLFQLIWPHPVTIKWLQDLAVFGAQVIAFRWITQLAATAVSPSREKTVAIAVALGAVLLVADPGFIDGNSFDVHTEAFAALAAVGAAHALYYGRRSVWLWVIAGLACGDVATGYLAAVGLSSLLLGRRWLRTGLLIAVAAVGWDLLLGAIERNHGYPGLGRLREPDEPDYAAQPAGAAECRDAGRQRPAASRPDRFDALGEPRLCLEEHVARRHLRLVVAAGADPGSVRPRPGAAQRRVADPCTRLPVGRCPMC